MEKYKDILETEKELREFVSFFLDLIRKKFFPFSAMVIANYNFGINLSVRFGKLENVEFQKNKNFSVVLFHNNRKGFSSSNDFSLPKIENIIKKAINFSMYTRKDVNFKLPDKKFLEINGINDLEIFFPYEKRIENTIEIIKSAESFALNSDKRIINTEGSSFASNTNISVIGNSYGIINSYKSTVHSISIGVLASDKNNNKNMEREHSYTIARDFRDLESPIEIGNKAAKKAISRLGAKKISTMKTCIIFSSDVASSLFSHFAQGITGVNIYKNNSFLYNKLNKLVFPNWLNIVDNPHLKKGLFSRPFDEEGVKTNILEVVKSGVLKTWLLDCYSSRRLGLKTTGHSGGIHNFIVTTENTSSFITFKEMLSEVSFGILVTELMGDGVNLINGDYSRGAFGFLIENGDIKYPVKEITISGNLNNIWKNILYIGNDINHKKNIQCGSILISEMQVSGL
ncbi:Metalloprotease PmbA [Buchnera aphidicola (Tetraneura ulmi)]|uniref:metalloprotease PmbA n=1 Tax=Buchnera aphidicola TaxID=9 RepID=UPI0034645452